MAGDVREGRQSDFQRGGIRVAAVAARLPVSSRNHRMIYELVLTHRSALRPGDCAKVNSRSETEDHERRLPPYFGR